MSSGWTKKPKRHWATLSVEGTPGYFRRLSEDEMRRRDWPSVNLSASTPNGKARNSTPDISATLPHPKLEVKASVFTSLPWNKGKKPMSSLDQEYIAVPTRDEATEAEVTSSPSESEQPPDSKLESASLTSAIQTVDNQSTRRTDISGSEGFLKTDSVQPENDVREEKEKTEKAEGDVRIASGLIRPQTKATGSEVVPNTSYPEDVNMEEAGNSPAVYGDTKNHPDQGSPNGLSDYQQPSTERQVAYLGPVLLSPLHQQQERHVHITVALGSDVQSVERNLRFSPTCASKSEAPGSSENNKENQVQTNAISIFCRHSSSSPASDSTKSSDTASYAVQREKEEPWHQTEADEDDLQKADSTKALLAVSEPDRLQIVHSQGAFRAVLPSQDQDRCIEAAGKADNSADDSLLADSRKEGLTVMRDDIAMDMESPPFPIPVDQSVFGTSSAVHSSSWDVDIAACSAGPEDDFSSKTQWTSEPSSSTCVSSTFKSCLETKLHYRQHHDPAENNVKLAAESSGSRRHKASYRDVQSPVHVENAAAAEPATCSVPQRNYPTVNQQSRNIFQKEESNVNENDRLQSTDRCEPFPLAKLDHQSLLSAASGREDVAPGARKVLELSTSRDIHPQSQNTLVHEHYDSRGQTRTLEPTASGVSKQSTTQSAQIIISSSAHVQADLEQTVRSSAKQSRALAEDQDPCGPTNDTADKPALRQPEGRPQKPMRSSLVLEAAGNTESMDMIIDRPLLPLRDSLKLSTSSSSSASSLDSDDVKTMQNIAVVNVKEDKQAQQKMAPTENHKERHHFKAELSHIPTSPFSTNRIDQSHVGKAIPSNLKSDSVQTDITALPISDTQFLCGLSGTSDTENLYSTVDKKKAPVFVTPPPPPTKPARTRGSQSDLSDRSCDLSWTPPKPARMMDRLYPHILSTSDVDLKKNKSGISDPSLSPSSEPDSRPPEVPPRRDKPRLDRTRLNGSSDRSPSPEPSARKSFTASDDECKLSPLSRQKNTDTAIISEHMHRAVELNLSTKPAQTSDRSASPTFVPYEDSGIYYKDTASTLKEQEYGSLNAAQSLSSSDISKKGKRLKEKVYRLNKSSSALNEARTSWEPDPPPVPPRQRVGKKKSLAHTSADLSMSESSVTSQGSRSSRDRTFEAQLIHDQHEDISKIAGSAVQHSDSEPKTGRAGSHDPSGQRSSRQELKLQKSKFVKNKSRSQSPDVTDSGFSLSVRSTAGSPRTKSPGTTTRRTSPSKPAAGSKKPASCPAYASDNRMETRYHTDTSETSVTSTTCRTTSVSSATSSVNTKDCKEAKSKLNKYWPFQRGKKDKNDNKRQKEKEKKKQASSPSLPSPTPLHQSTPTVSRRASGSKVSHKFTFERIFASNKVKPLVNGSSVASAKGTGGPNKDKKSNVKKEHCEKGRPSSSAGSTELDLDDTCSKDSDKSVVDKAKEYIRTSAECITEDDESANYVLEETLQNTSRISKEGSVDECNEHDTSLSSGSSLKNSQDKKAVGEKQKVESSFAEPALTPPRLASPLREVDPSPYPPTPVHRPVMPEEQQPRFDGEFQHLDGEIQADAAAASVLAERRPPMVVVAIDLGTTHSGYAFSFSRDPSSVYMMSRWAGQEPGLLNHKTLSALLLTPDARFHSFGLAARSHYHNLLPIEARHWLYFERFKMTLHHCKELTRDTMVTAVNGQQLPVLTVFAHVLEFFVKHALQQLSDQSGIEFRPQDVLWVVTVPAIWREPAKQLMRQAALASGMFTKGDSSQLLIVLEPEAASVYCRRLRTHQLMPDAGTVRPLQSPRRSVDVPNMQPAVSSLTVDESKSSESLDSLAEPTLENKIKGSRYMVVDCGGGTVDITVHELDASGQLIELHRASGGPHGSTGVDAEFQALLCSIFTPDFVDNYKRQFPVGWVNLMTDFESRKRTASPLKTTSFNISLPFTFICEFRKHKGEVEHAVKRHADPDVEWSLQGMLRLAPAAMQHLFAPTLISIRQAIGDVLNHPNTRDLHYLFLVGGFAESPLLQHDIRREFGHLLTVLIPQDVSLAVLRGAVLFGLDPRVVRVRCARLTYGVGILNRFNPAKHPEHKRVHKDHVDWCSDVFDRFVVINQPVTVGTTVTRRYTPARPGQVQIVLNIYSSVNPNPAFVTDPGVRKCGTLFLDLRSSVFDSHSVDCDGDGKAEGLKLAQNQPREILTCMAFGETEISVTAIDVISGKKVMATADFLCG